MRSGATLLVVLLVAGCVRLGFDHDRSAGTNDGAAGDGPVGDIGDGGEPPPRDAGVDARPTDAPVATGDTTLLQDGPIVDQPVALDLPATSDLPVVPDLPVAPDLPVVSTVCASSTPKLVYGSNMVICGPTSSTMTANQCSAAQWCATGWHMCTATEFLARGGKPVTSPVSAWIQSCVRSGGKSHAPTNTTCTCTGGASTVETLAWPCASGTPIGYPSKYVGVVTASSCNKVGTNGAAWTGMWLPAPSLAAKIAVVCCK